MIQLFDSLRRQLIHKLNEHILDLDQAVIAVSGGIDSMCLLHLLANNQMRSSAKLFCKLRVIHIDHGIRSRAESERDIACIRSQCDILNLPLQVFSAPRGEIFQWHKEAGGLEAAARLFRYRTMQDNLEQKECILTAHHADDLVETMMLSFFNGVISNGALAARRSKILRPFLLLNDIPGRDTILRIVQEQNIPYVEDSTNINEDHRRNFLRNTVIPTISQQFTLRNMQKMKAKFDDLLDALDSCAPLTPWQDFLILGSAAARCLLQDLEKLPQYFCFLYCRQAMIRSTGRDQNDSSGHRITRSFLLSLTTQFLATASAGSASGENKRFEGFGCTFIKTGKWVYLLPTLAIYEKRGYFIRIDIEKICILRPFADVMLTACVRKYQGLESYFYLRSAGGLNLNKTLPGLESVIGIVPSWCRRFISILEGEQSVLGLIYPDFENVQWRFISSMFDKRIQIDMEQKQ